MGLSWEKMASCYYLRSYSSHFYHFNVRGLYNYGLSCCINALLQSFSATTELVEILNRWRPTEEVGRHNVPMQLRDALYAMRDPSHRSPHEDFLNCLHYHSIHRRSQHDADEIFHIILNLTQKQMPDKDLAQEIQKLFEIRVETQVVCDTCKNIYKKPSSLFSLPLPIREGENTLVIMSNMHESCPSEFQLFAVIEKNQDLLETTMTLQCHLQTHHTHYPEKMTTFHVVQESCIQSFSQQQTLMDDDECYCDECAEKTPSTHKLKLVSLPAVLCIHLKRFRNDYGYIRKLDSKVTFSEALNVDILDAEQSKNADEYYSLYAVIVHIGNPIFGHYTAFIRPNQDQQWFYADDSYVQQVTWADVQNTFEGRETAYLLLYRKTTQTASG